MYYEYNVYLRYWYKILANIIYSTKYLVLHNKNIAFDSCVLNQFMCDYMWHIQVEHGPWKLLDRKKYLVLFYIGMKVIRQKQKSSFALPKLS